MIRQISSDERKIIYGDDYVDVIIPMTPTEAKLFARPTTIDPAWRIRVCKETHIDIDPPIKIDYGAGNPRHGRVLYEGEIAETERGKNDD